MHVETFSVKVTCVSLVLCVHHHLIAATLILIHTYTLVILCTLKYMIFYYQIKLHVHTYMHAYIHIYVYIYIQKHTQTYTHIYYAHTHMCSKHSLIP
jgi:hypothetical protein